MHGGEEQRLGDRPGVSVTPVERCDSVDADEQPADEGAGQAT